MTIEERIQIIEQRNKRVEVEKAWETSFVRVSTIMLLTYVIACGVLFVIGNGNPFRNALIPVVGYFLSTLSLLFIKRFWMEEFFSK